MLRREILKWLGLAPAGVMLHGFSRDAAPETTRLEGDALLSAIVVQRSETIENDRVRFQALLKFRCDKACLSIMAEVERRGWVAAETQP